MILNMENKENKQDFPPLILKAPKLKFKIPKIKPTPFNLNESTISTEESINDIENNFSLDELNDFKKYIKANSLLVMLKSIKAQ